jgi:hypothetical protein
VKVPAPWSRDAAIMARDRVDWFVYQSFQDVQNGQCDLDLDEVIRALPMVPEAKLELRIKEFASCDRGGTWHLAAPLPPLEQIRQIVTPENVCLFEAMMRSNAKLLQLGFIDKDDNQVAKISEKFDKSDAQVLTYLEEAILSASWNVTGNWETATSSWGILRLHEAGNEAAVDNDFRSDYVNMARVLTTEDLKRHCKNSGEVMQARAGTETDIRALNLSNLEKLLLFLGCPRGDIERMDFGDRRSKIAELCNLKYMDGDRSDIVLNYYRPPIPSAKQLQDKYTEQVKSVLNRQIELLRGEDRQKMERSGRIAHQISIKDKLNKSMARIEKDVDRAIATYKAPTPAYLRQHQQHPYTSDAARAATTLVEHGRVRHAVIRQKVQLLDEYGFKLYHDPEHQKHPMIVTRYVGKFF